MTFAGDGIEVAFVPLGTQWFTGFDGWLAPRYGRRVPAPVLRTAVRRSCGMSFGYLILQRNETEWA